MITILWTVRKFVTYLVLKTKFWAISKIRFNDIHIFWAYNCFVLSVLNHSTLYTLMSGFFWTAPGTWQLKPFRFDVSLTADPNHQTGHGAKMLTWRIIGDKLFWSYEIAI